MMQSNKKVTTTSVQNNTICSLAVAKGKVMHVGRNNPEYDYTMRGVKLGKTDEEKDIGVTITKNLKPSVQCEKAAGRAMAVLNQI